MQPRMTMCLAAILSLTLLGQARAQEAAKPDYAAAKTHFKAGQEFFQMDRYAEAIVEFKKAYEITKDGLVMGQIAESYARASDFENALASIKLYHDSLPEGEREAAAQLVKEYEKAIKEGRSQKLVLPTEKPKEEVAATVEEKTTAAASTDEGHGKRRRIYTWISLGVTGALVVSAMAMGLSAQSKYDDLSNTCKPNCPASEVDSIKSRALITDVLWGTAVAGAIATGIIAWAESRPSHGPPSEGEPEGEPEEESASHRFQLNPLVGGGAYGMSAGIQF